MGSRLNRIAVVVLAVVAVCSRHALEPRSDSTTGKTLETRRNIGLIEHRCWRLEDFMEYRAALANCFGDPYFVSTWGRLLKEHSVIAGHRRHLYEERWAGMNLTDHSDK